MVLLITPMSLVPALFVWQWPPWQLWPWVIGMGALGSFGHMCYIRAFALADASAVMPYDYTRLIFAAVIGYFAFAEVPDLWTFVGAIVIAGAALTSPTARSSCGSRRRPGRRRRPAKHRRWKRPTCRPPSAKQTA